MRQIWVCNRARSAPHLRLIDESIIADRLFVTTHTLPLTFLIKVLRDFVPEVKLLAIQPSLVAFPCPLSPEVRRAVETIHASRQTDAERTNCLGDEDERQGHCEVLEHGRAKLCSK